MSFGERAWSTASPSRITLAAAVVVVCAALIGVLVDRSTATSTGDATGTPSASVGTTPTPMAPSVSLAPGPPGAPDRLPREQQRGLAEADGVVPAGVTVFDGAYPAVANLDAALLGALRQATEDAARQGVTLYVDSGWRSPKYQEQLLRRAIAEYGSEAEAARWVATPDTSAHVSGDAVDIGHADATAWLSEAGANYGLCQIYRNEPWHYELRPGAVDHGCPRMYADASQDPRMQP